MAQKYRKVKEELQQDIHGGSLLIGMGLGALLLWLFQHQSGLRAASVAAARRSLQARVRRAPRPQQVTVSPANFQLI